MNSEKVKTLLEFPWSGENYSQKIWGCDDRFVKMLNKNLSLGLVTGQTYSEIIKSIKKECDAQKYQIERLVRTEGTFIANQGSLDAYSQLGVKKYRFVARLDSRTSPQCRELNGKVFNVSEAIAGENLPPLHPNCRSTTVAVWDEEKEEKKENYKTFTEEELKKEYNRLLSLGNKYSHKPDKNSMYPFHTWEMFRDCYYEANKQIQGATVKGTKIKHVSAHATMRMLQRKVSPKELKTMLEKPKEINNIVYDAKNNRYKFNIISNGFFVFINPNIGNIITVWHPDHDRLDKI